MIITIILETVEGRRVRGVRQGTGGDGGREAWRNLVIVGEIVMVTMMVECVNLRGEELGRR